VQFPSESGKASGCRLQVSVGITEAWSLVVDGKIGKVDMTVGLAVGA
jgi:hypothetical protein